MFRLVLAVRRGMVRGSLVVWCGIVLVTFLCLVFVGFVSLPRFGVRGVRRATGDTDNREIAFYDAQIASAFHDTVDPTVLAPLHGVPATKVDVPDFFKHLPHASSSRSSDSDAWVRGGMLPSSEQHLTQWNSLLQSERTSECILPLFHARDATLLPNASRIVLRGCAPEKRNVRKTWASMATLVDGKLRIDTTNVCVAGGKYSKLNKGSEVDGFRTVWIPFEGGETVEKRVKDEFVIVKCHTKTTTVEKVLVQAPPREEPAPPLDQEVLGSSFVKLPPVLQQSMPFARSNTDAEMAAKRRPMGGRAPNVLLIILDAVSNRQLQRSLPLTWKWLQSVGKGGTHRSVHFPRHHALHAQYAGNIASLFSGMSTTDLITALRNEAKSKGESPIEWLWDVYRKHGYNVVMNENGCATNRVSLFKAARIGGTAGFKDGGWSRSIDDAGLQSLACHFAQENPTLIQFKNAPMEMCIHGQYFHSFFLKHMQLYMGRHAPKRPTFYTLQLNEGRDPSMKRLYSMDKDLRDALRQTLQTHPDTVLVLMSPQGLASGKYFETTESGHYEHSLPFLNIVLPNMLRGTSADRWQEALASNAASNKLTTHVDVYHTLKDLVLFHNSYHAEPWPTKHGQKTVRPISLLRPRFLVHQTARRDCETAGVPDDLCSCVEWRDTKESVLGLSEFALSTVNGEMWARNRQSFSGCHSLRLSTVVKKYKMHTSLKATRQNGLVRSPFPFKHRYRIELTTRAGEGFGQERFVFEVSRFDWNFYIVQRPHIQTLDLHNSVFSLDRKFRTSLTARYRKCLGPNDAEKDLAFCVCNVGIKDDGMIFFGEESNDHNAALIHMVKKDNVDLVRWTHGNAEQLEVINNQAQDIIFQIAIRRSTSENIRASRILPVWKLVPAKTRQPLVTLEQANMQSKWQWNFDWRWDLLPKGKSLPKDPNAVLGHSFRTSNIHFQYANGVSMIRFVDVFTPGEKVLYYQVTNYRQKPITVTVSLSIPTEYEKRIDLPSSLVITKEITALPVSVVRLVALDHDTAAAREALNHVQFHVQWKTTPSSTKKHSDE